jgi:imidazolonepropionase-like amidohydrolase
MRSWVFSVAILVGSIASAQTSVVHAGRIFDPIAAAYRENQGVLIENGFIRQVGTFDAVKAAAPQAALIVLSRLTVLPGLIDAHTHLLLAIPEKMNGADAIILTIARYSPAKRALTGAGLARELLESGFTFARNVGHSGFDGDVALREAINNRWVPGPRVLASARKIVPRGGQALPVQDALLEPILRQEYLEAATPEEGRRAVLDNFRAGADLIKVVVDEGARTIDTPTLRAIVEEAHRAGSKVAAHATSRGGIQSAIESGVDSIEHADEATLEQFQAMHANGIYLVPTLWPTSLAVRWPGLAGVDAPRRLLTLDRDADRMQYHEEQIAKMALARKAGVRIVFGSDNCFAYEKKARGEATIELLAAMAEFRIEPGDALRAATSGAAELLGIRQYGGSIEAGKFGDLVAIDGDPLHRLGDVVNVKFVMKGGRVVRDGRQP